MAKPVKKRAYTSTVRTEQAARTRERIVAAAADLFGAEGYGRTTIKQIAAAAEVAVDTVYATFGTKANVLTAIIDSRLAPSGESNLMERAEAQAVRDAPDLPTAIRRFAGDMAGVLDRVGPVFEILRTASAVEPEMAHVLDMMNGYRLENMRRAAGWFADLGPLRVDVEEAARTMWAVASPDVGRLLRVGQGLTLDEHAAWLEHVLLAALAPAPRRRTR